MLSFPKCGELLFEPAYALAKLSPFSKKSLHTSSDLGEEIVNLLWVVALDSSAKGSPENIEWR
jgi:hypothetical protein